MSERYVIDDRNRHENVITNGRTDERADKRTNQQTGGVTRKNEQTHEMENGTTRITKNFSNELAMEPRHYCIRGRR